jgi:hypothetical protein
MDPLQDALDIEEMEKSAGWALLTTRLKEEITRTEADQREIKVEGRRPDEVGAEYISCAQTINGLRKVFEIVEDIKAHKNV